MCQVPSFVSGKERRRGEPHLHNRTHGQHRHRHRHRHRHMHNHGQPSKERASVPGSAVRALLWAAVAGPTTTNQGKRGRSQQWAPQTSSERGGASLVGEWSHCERGKKKKKKGTEHTQNLGPRCLSALWGQPLSSAHSLAPAPHFFLPLSSVSCLSAGRPRPNWHTDPFCLTTVPASDGDERKWRRGSRSLSQQSRQLPETDARGRRKLRDAVDQLNLLLLLGRPCLAAKPANHYNPGPHTDNLNHPNLSSIRRSGQHSCLQLRLSSSPASQPASATTTPTLEIARSRCARGRLPTESSRIESSKGQALD
ncbi:hypothetical protein JOL62DRAFT_2035 [Phyllosticta paracitricarpa]|uniref:Uncharacterized protein n=1 Tax=Phyllosticta paracitricarpa TaxID=2016321 RepID=A0ABR1NJJ7_9PEZI